jgi:hypothetical protein
MNVKNFTSVEFPKAIFYLALIIICYISCKDDGLVEGMPQHSEPELTNSAIKRLNPCERAVWR